MTRILNTAAFLGIIFFGSAIDSPSTLPLKGVAICLAWLLFSMSRGWA
jgi:hypothetical protein